MFPIISTRIPSAPRGRQPLRRWTQKPTGTQAHWRCCLKTRCWIGDGRVSRQTFGVALQPAQAAGQGINRLNEPDRPIRGISLATCLP